MGNIFNKKKDKGRFKSQSNRVFFNIIKQKKTVISLFILFLLISMALFAPLLTKYNPIKQNLAIAFEKPFSRDHILGTDELGRDLFSRIAYGARLTIGTSIITIVIAIILGSTLGIIAGYYGRFFDNLIMRFIDILMTFPCIVLGIIIVSLLGPSLQNAALAVAIYNIPVFARAARINVLEIKKNEYIEISQFLNLGDFFIIMNHIIPNIISIIFILGTLNIGNAVVIISSLGFLGMGAQPPFPEWGAILSSGRQYLLLAPHIIIIQGFFIFMFVLSINLIGDGLRDALDPNLQL